MWRHCPHTFTALMERCVDLSCCSVGYYLTRYNAKCQQTLWRRASVMSFDTGLPGELVIRVLVFGRGWARVQRRRNWRRAASAWMILCRGRRLKRCRACITSTQGVLRSGSGSRGGLCAALCARRLSLRDNLVRGRPVPSLQKGDELTQTNSTLNSW